MEQRSWMAGVAKSAAGVLCAAALASACAWAQPLGSTPQQAGEFAAGELQSQRADMKLLGLPESALAYLKFNPAESLEWAKLAQGYPGAQGAVWRAYSMPSGPGNGMGMDSGGAGFDGVECRIAMPDRRSANAGLASMLGVTASKATAMGLAALEAAHELGHCAALSRGASAGQPDALAAAERSAFDPEWAALQSAGLPARIWGESYADAFMAVETLAKDGASPASMRALAAIGKARQRQASMDPEHSGGFAAIGSALDAAARWGSMPVEQRLQAAAKIAGEAASAAIRVQASSAGGWEFSSLSAPSLAMEALLDASARLQDGGGQVRLGDELNLTGVGADSDGASLLSRMSDKALAALASQAGARGIDWSKPSRPMLAKAIAAAALDQALVMAASDFAGQSKAKMESFVTGPKALGAMGELAARSYEVASRARVGSAKPSLGHSAKF